MRSRLVRDLSSGDRKVYLDVPMRRVQCSECGVKTEKLDWLAALPRYTQRFALFVGERCRESSLTDVARQTGLHWHTVKDLDKLYMEEQLRRAGPPQPQRIGIDEIAIGKHHQYRIVVSDLDAGRPIWFGGIDRSEASLNLFYATLTPENKAQLKIAVMDMWKAFRQSTLQHAPQTLIIYDKFHILRHLQDAMDRTRRQEYKRLDGDERRYIKGQRYTLLSHWKNLDQEGRQSLKELFQVNRRLNKAYLLKEQFGQLWDYYRPEWARKFFAKWKSSLRWQRLPEFEKFAAMIEKHWDGIIPYCDPDNKVSLGMVEGLNNLIRALQRRAYGYRDEDYLRLKILTQKLPAL